ncbi:amino acid/polyamine/organocation transporter, APC superfamily [Sphingopyxis sp. YR583]|uniref:APC family permease n=1 Tax=Sphingopyxis sp. YR583 TaxID=1881047 RepID=UPI0008A7A097|nr:amino acid permease [Sphingopyxis sp. YR583]SEH16688.1 amino acid/polyamine/organocation transporter, APC superfamily [Sphingopyxis sp. YR583]
MTDTATNNERPGQKLGLLMCVALGMGNMIGSGVFLLPRDLAPLGWNAVVGWGVSIAGTLCLAVVFARLARRLPEGCAAFTYAASAFGPGTGFIVAWSYWISCWTVVATLAVAAISNMSILMPWLGEKGAAPALIAIACIWFFTLVNLFGVRRAGGAQLLTLGLKLIPVIGAVFVGVWALGTGAAPPPTMAGTEPISLSGVSSAATLTLFALLGFESACVVSDRVKDPERTVPRATVIAAAAVGLLYLLSCTTVTLLVPVDALHDSNAAYATFFSRLVSPGAGQVVALFAAIAALGALNGFVLLQGDIPRDLAHRCLLPAAFARDNKFASPWITQIVSSALASVIVYANYSRGLADLFAFMVKVTTSTAIILYIVGAAAALLLERRGAIKVSAGFAAATVIGFLYSAWAFYGAGLEASLWSLAMTAAGLPIYLAMRRSAPALTPAGSKEAPIA